MKRLHGLYYPMMFILATLNYCKFEILLYVFNNATLMIIKKA